MSSLFHLCFSSFPDIPTSSQHKPFSNHSPATIDLYSDQTRSSLSCQHPWPLLELTVSTRKELTQAPNNFPLSRSAKHISAYFLCHVRLFYDGIKPPATGKHYFWQREFSSSPKQPRVSLPLFSSG